MQTSTGKHHQVVFDLTTMHWRKNGGGGGGGGLEPPQKTIAVGYVPVPDP